MNKLEDEVQSHGIQNFRLPVLYLVSNFALL